MKFKKVISFLLAFVISNSMFLGTNVFSENNQKLLEKSNKIATNLNDDLETKITLSFPGKQESIPQDVVFVLDKSGASAKDEIFNQSKKFLEEIKNKATTNGLNIRIGVVLFASTGNIKQELTDITTGYDDILKALNSSVSFGTNMHAGLLAAKDMLDKDVNVKASNKHIVLISDGATYLYCNDNNYKGAYTRSFGDPKSQIDPTTKKNYTEGADRKGGIWEYQSREYNLKNDWKKFNDDKKTNFIFSYASGVSNGALGVGKDGENIKFLGEYLNYYREQEKDQTKNWKQYEYKYTLTSAYAGFGRKTTPIDINAPSNIDIAYIKTDDTFQEMVNAGYDMNVYFKNAADFNGKLFLRYLARNSNNGNLNTDFEKLKKQLLNKIAKGSYVEDIVGKDFTFVNDINKITLKVGDENLKVEKISNNEYGFEKIDNNNYRYTLKYEKNTKTKEEKLILKVNETIYPNKPVSLEYNEKLVNVPTETGEYKYYTNEKATLTPVDENNVKGQTIEFPKPEVTYKYIAPNNKVKFVSDNKEVATVEVEHKKTIASDNLTDQSMPENPTKEHYYFKEWNKKVDGTGEVFTKDTVVSEDITVYAIYEKLEKINYEYTSETEGKELPQEIKGLEPKEQEEKEGTEITPIKPKQTTVEIQKTDKTKEIWTFKGYDKEKLIVQKGKNTFQGKWACKEETKAQLINIAPTLEVIDKEI